MTNPALTQSDAQTIKTVEGNSLQFFIDAVDNTLKIKDVHGTVVSLVTIGSTPPPTPFIGQWWVLPTT